MNSGNLSALDRIQAAANSGDLDLVLTTIDEVCAPDMIVSTPLKLTVSGAEAQKVVFRTLHETGRIAQTWGVVDTAAQMRQLGLIPDIKH